MIFSSFFGVSLVSSTLLINPVKNQILLDGQCCCVDYLSKTWIFHWLREHGMPTVNLLRTHPLICAIPTLCFSEKIPPVAVLFAIFKCSMQQRNLRCIWIKLGWYIYIYIYTRLQCWCCIWLLNITALVLVLDPRLIFGWYITDQHWYMPPKPPSWTPTWHSELPVLKWSFANKTWGLWRSNLDSHNTETPDPIAGVTNSTLIMDTIMKEKESTKELVQYNIIIWTRQKENPLNVFSLTSILPMS